MVNYSIDLGDEVVLQKTLWAQIFRGLISGLLFTDPNFSPQIHFQPIVFRLYMFSLGQLIHFYSFNTIHANDTQISTRSKSFLLVWTCVSKMILDRYTSISSGMPFNPNLSIQSCTHYLTEKPFLLGNRSPSSTQNMGIIPDSSISVCLTYCANQLFNLTYLSLPIFPHFPLFTSIISIPLLVVSHYMSHFQFYITLIHPSNS